MIQDYNLCNNLDFTGWVLEKIYNDGLSITTLEFIERADVFYIVKITKQKKIRINHKPFENKSVTYMLVPTKDLLDTINDAKYIRKQ